MNEITNEITRALSFKFRRQYRLAKYSERPVENALHVYWSAGYVRSHESTISICARWKSGELAWEVFKANWAGQQSEIETLATFKTPQEALGYLNEI